MGVKEWREFWCSCQSKVVAFSLGSIYELVICPVSPPDTSLPDKPIFGCCQYCLPSLPQAIVTGGFSLSFRSRAFKYIIVTGILDWGMEWREYLFLIGCSYLEQFILVLSMSRFFPGLLFIFFRVLYCANSYLLGDRTPWLPCQHVHNTCSVLTPQNYLWRFATASSGLMKTINWTWLIIKNRRVKHCQGGKAVSCDDSQKINLKCIARFKRTDKRT